jgi:hypothetical protein
LDACNTHRSPHTNATCHCHQPVTPPAEGPDPSDKVAVSYSWYGNQPRMANGLDQKAIHSWDISGDYFLLEHTL